MLIYKARENSSVGNGTVPLKKIKKKIKGWGVRIAYTGSLGMTYLHYSGHIAYYSAS